MELIVEIETPGNGKVYEFRADETLTAGQLKALAAGEIAQFENGGVALDPGAVRLFHKRRRRVVEEGVPLAAAGIRSGDRLLML